MQQLLLASVFYCASVCEGDLGSRNSVCPSVCLSHAWTVTNLNGALQIFWYHTKGQSLCYSDTNSGWWATLPSLWNLCSKWPTVITSFKIFLSDFKAIYKSTYDTLTLNVSQHFPETHLLTFLIWQATQIANAMTCPANIKCMWTTQQCNYHTAVKLVHWNLSLSLMPSN